MNELTLKQKAEAYDRALERAREALNDGRISFNTIAYLQDIFPELKDEMIKKKLLSLIEWSKSFNNASGITNEEAKEMSDWIEKQSEQKTAKWSEEDKLHIKELESLVKGAWAIAEHENDKNTINKLSDLSFFLKTLKPKKPTDGIDDVVNFSNEEKCLDEDLEKRLDEQKPKFKIGDWVVVNNKHQSIYKVEKIEDGYYILRHTHGGTFRVCVLHDGSLRPWTIQDAKDGDVIITKNKIIFIFKLIRDCTIYDYCGLYFGKFIEFSSAVNGRLAAKLPTNYAPATKEQRDTLMKAMTDAGYAFDFEKKELKKIEQKSEPKFKVGDWIIFNNNSDAHRVEEIEDDVYTLRNSIGGKMVLSSVFDKLIRHWTIKDAEDGDILVIAENGEPFIFKDCSDTSHPDEPVAYCGIVYGDDFHISPNDKWWTSAKVLPATKEQRNILFEKMKKAGYEWDAEKKKLKKIKK